MFFASTSQLNYSSVGKAAALPAGPAIAVNPPQEPDIDTARKYQSWERREEDVVSFLMQKQRANGGRQSVTRRAYHAPYPQLRKIRNPRNVVLLRKRPQNWLGCSIFRIITIRRNIAENDEYQARKNEMLTGRPFFCPNVIYAGEGYYPL